MTDGLRARIEALAERGVEALVRSRRPRHRRAAVAGALPWLLVVPGLVVVLQLLRFAASNGPLPLTAGGFVVATLSTFGLVWLWNVTAARPPRPGRATGLSTADCGLDAEDRLTAADEFLGRAARTPFEEAAVRDAERFVEAHERARLEVSTASGAPLAKRAFAWGVTAAGLLAVGVAMNRVDVAVPSRLAGAGAVSVASAPNSDVARATNEAREVTLFAAEDPAPYERRADAPADPAAPDEPSRTESGESTDRAKVSRGKTGAGRSAQARSLSGASESRGVPTSQAQTSKEPPKDLTPAKKKKEKKARPPAEDDALRKKAPPEESGATAGRGAARGSNRNPASTDWSSKDQVTTPDDEELSDDEDVEDESEEDEARGGVQPHLRDRRPPVSRDLQIGFGNNANPDANSRGGPSQQKKSRGTASLVLGVPIPDRVKGQPNPGRTKVTQERVEPRREEAADAVAEARPTRGGPVGPIGRPELPPWLRRLLKDYYLELRAAERGEP